MDDTNEGPVFRASKRRKVYRKRADDDEGDGDTATPAGAATMTHDNKDEAEPEIRDGHTALKQRRIGGSRKGGVGFSTAEIRRAGDDSRASSANNTDAPGTPLSAVELAQARFVAPTGHVASGDEKHMVAYVDSKLARLRSSHEATSSTDKTASLPTDISASAPTTATTNTHSAAQGHLHEVDVAAKSTATPSTRPPKRPRRDWRNRRNSADLARDAMVDQILRESQLHHYSAESRPTASASAGHNQDADERMAEEFKRNFYAAAEERAVRRPAPAPPTYGANKLESIKGPKLGGSRSQRAAMHAAEKAKTAKK